MNTDFRLDVGFFDHHKTRRLIAALGLPAAWALIRLWAFAAVNKPDGVLSRMTDDDIAVACHYEGDAAEFVATLRLLRWVRNGRRSTCLNDWSEHQPFAINAPRRQAAAKKAATDRWNRKKEEDARRMRSAYEAHAGSNAPTSPTSPPKPASKASTTEDGSAMGEDAIAPPAVLTFPTTGKGPDAWDLTREQVDEWQSLYPNVSVETECRKALGWIKANNPKTAGGMQRFLVGWLNKATDRAGRSGKLSLTEQNEIATRGWGEPA